MTNVIAMPTRINKWQDLLRVRHTKKTMAIFCNIDKMDMMRRSKNKNCEGDNRLQQSIYLLKAKPSHEESRRGK